MQLDAQGVTEQGEVSRVACDHEVPACSATDHDRSVDHIRRPRNATRCPGRTSTGLVEVLDPATRKQPRHLRLRPTTPALRQNASGHRWHDAALERPPRPVVGDARALPVADGAADGVLCSNMLEHTPDPLDVLDELARVTRPGGWAWVSWTNWYSAWGGHHITPLHYLGPRLGAKAYERLKGPPPKNQIFNGLWPTYVGATAN